MSFDHQHSQSLSSSSLPTSLSLSLLLLFFFDLLTNPVAHRQIGYYYLLNSTLSIYSYLQSSHREITGDENKMTRLLDSIPSKTTKDDCLDWKFSMRRLLWFDHIYVIVCVFVCLRIAIISSKESDKHNNITSTIEGTVSLYWSDITWMACVSTVEYLTAKSMVVFYFIPQWTPPPLHNSNKYQRLEIDMIENPENVGRYGQFQKVSCLCPPFRL